MAAEESMDRNPIQTDSAPEAIGPYSQAVVHDGVLYCSGQIPLDPATGEAEDSSLGAETTRCLRNLEGVCEAAGTALEHAVRLTVYTTNLEGFAEINEAYAAFFESDPPARAAVGVAALPKGARVEIDAIVAIPG
jgi:2-iminobutanoate/2-iminopropanoate deaminase